MSEKVKNRGQAKRWNYFHPIKIIEKNVPQSEGEITSISKSGILFHALTQYRIGISVGIQWKDPDAGIIQGIFNIRSGAKAHDRDGYYFRARFYKLDTQNKQNIISILQNLQSLKSCSESLTVEDIKKVVMADVDLFSQFSRDRKYNNLAVQTLLQQVSDPVFDKCAHPEDTFEQGLQQIQMYYIHFSLIYAFLHNAKQYSSQDLTYCANLIHNLLQQYLALENENVTVIPEDPIATQEDDTEVDPNKAKQREEREKLILVFTSLSNSSFDIAQKIIIIFRNKQWAQKISDNSPEAILAVEKQAQISIDYFTNHIDVTVDHISDMDMILTRSTYELNQQEEAEEQPALPPVDLANKKTLRNLFILGFLVIVFMLSAWQSFTVPNFKSKYASQLHLPGLKITKINQSDDTLMVYAKTRDKTTLDRNYANMLEVEKNAYAFLDKNTKFRGIILFSHKKQLVKMFPRKFE